MFEGGKIRSSAANDKKVNPVEMRGRIQKENSKGKFKRVQSKRVQSKRVQECF
ncbi:hypothetical protein [Methanosarcina barkeri]|nr:hypothetical protein [Methanosarcina barkeri]